MTEPIDTDAVSRKPWNDRGFLVYGDEPIRCTYGTEIVVTESSAAEDDFAWLRVTGYDAPTEGESLELAIPAWHDDRWPDKRDPRVIAAKLAEECGEVCGAVIKQREGRRTRQDIADEIGDVLVVLTVLASRYGLPSLEDLRAARFAEVRARA